MAVRATDIRTGEIGGRGHGDAVEQIRLPARILGDVGRLLCERGLDRIRVSGGGLRILRRQIHRIASRGACRRFEVHHIGGRRSRCHLIWLVEDVVEHVDRQGMLSWKHQQRLTVSGRGASIPGGTCHIGHNRRVGSIHGEWGADGQDAERHGPQTPLPLLLLHVEVTCGVLVRCPPPQGDYLVLAVGVG